MARPTFEQTIELKAVGKQVYENATYPVWTWPGTKVFPGGTLMVHATAAAFKTVSSEFTIDTVQAYFLSAPDARQPIRYTVNNLSDGGRFATRSITAEQNGRNVVHVTCSFVRAATLTGPSMVHSIQRQSKGTIKTITLDDLAIGRNEHGPYMKFQRLPLESIGRKASSEKPDATSQVYTSAATIFPRVESPSSRVQSLGILALSDYHVLDGAPALHGITTGQHRINDNTLKPTQQNFKQYTSLNHTVHFARHEGFRADEMCYIEVTSTWAERRRAEMQTRIFDSQGVLIASCVQGAYYVLKDDQDRSKI